MPGEQFALPDAVERLREVRRTKSDDRLITISGADPLNLTGIIAGEERIRSSAASRIVYRNGVPVAAMEGDLLRTFAISTPTPTPMLRQPRRAGAYPLSAASWDVSDYDSREVQRAAH